MEELTGPLMIRERTDEFAEPLTMSEYGHALARASRAHHEINQWNGQGRDGRPLTVVWIAGQRSGVLFTAFEITGTEE